MPVNSLMSTRAIVCLPLLSGLIAAYFDPTVDAGFEHWFWMLGYFAGMFAGVLLALT